MSYFTRQVAPDGGLLVFALIGLSEARRAALAASNQPIPAPVTVSALIDTGASCTCVDSSILTGLNLTPTGTATVRTPTTGSQPAVVDQYDIGLAIPATPGASPLILATIPAIKAELANQRFLVLIRKDITQRSIIVYERRNRNLTLAV